MNVCHCILGTGFNDCKGCPNQNRNQSYVSTPAFNEHEYNLLIKFLDKKIEEIKERDWKPCDND